MSKPNAMELREFFRILTPAQAEKLSEFMSSKTFKPGHVFCRAGTPVQRKKAFVLFILEGKILVTSEDNDISQVPILRTMETGEMFGLVSFLATEIHTATCKAETEVRAAVLARADFDKLREEYQVVATAFMMMIARQLARDVRACNGRLAAAITGKSPAKK